MLRNAIHLSLAALVTTIMCPPSSALAFRGGPIGGWNGSVASSGNCMSCHGSRVGIGSVTVSGAPTSYSFNQTYDLTVRVADPDQLGAGFQISVEDAVGNHVGVLIITDNVNTQPAPVNPGWVTHTFTGVGNAVAGWAALGNAAEFKLRWRAPATDVGEIMFYLAGNAINNDGQAFNGLDTIYLAAQSATAGDTCGDGKQNNGEAGIDCGGPCPACECLADADCDDGDDCTDNLCTDNQCVDNEIADCCRDNSECDDTNPCTSDSCESLSCTSQAIVGCCLADVECDDGDDCTEDRCSAHACVNDAIPNCCTVNVDCDDGVFCNGTEICGGTGSCEPGKNPCKPGEFCDEVNNFCCELVPGNIHDCNGNDVPDECEIAVSHNCCEIGHGTGCNDASIETCVCAVDPVCCDETWDRVCVEEVETQGCGTCDIVRDCNDNGIPDECEADCNENGVPDDCDLASGDSADCNCNEVLDECEINTSTVVDCTDASGPCDEGPFFCTSDCEPDVNTNGIPDCCDADIGPASCPDCCGMASLIGVVFADADPIAPLAFDQPGQCDIDAREPHSINNATARNGWDRMVISFSCDPATIGLVPGDFSVTGVPAGVVPGVSSVPIDSVANTATVMLDDMITPGNWTCIAHPESGSEWCAGFLPADASQDGLSTANDINALINAINLLPGLELPIYATDINRSGVTNGQDILRLIDLLNGAGDFDPWIAQGLPLCPSAGNGR